MRLGGFFTFFLSYSKRGIGDIFFVSVSFINSWHKYEFQYLSCFNMNFNMIELLKTWPTTVEWEGVVTLWFQKHPTTPSPGRNGAEMLVPITHCAVERWSRGRGSVHSWQAMRGSIWGGFVGLDQWQVSQRSRHLWECPSNGVGIML